MQSIFRGSLKFKSDEYTHDTLPFVYPAKSNFESLTINLKKRRSKPLPTTVTFSGHVKDEKGTPFKSTKVTYRDSAGQGTSVTTDNKGYYLFQTKYNPGCFLSATSPGYARKLIGTPPNVGTNDNPRVYDITLAPGHWIELTINNEIGEPVSQSELVFSEMLDPHGFVLVTLDNLRQEEPKNSKANYRFCDLPDGKVHLTVSHNEYTEFSGQLDVDQCHEITLYAPGVIMGEVVDSTDNSPIQNFEIMVNKHRKTLYNYNIPQSFPDPEGLFALNRLNRTSDYTLTVTANGYVPKVIEAVEATLPDEKNFLKIEMVRQSFDTLLVLDAETKTPLSGVPITFLDADQRELTWETLSLLQNVPITGNDGTININTVQQDQRIVIHPFKDYESTAKIFDELEETEGKKVLHLKKGCTIIGTLSDALEYDPKKINLAMTSDLSDTLLANHMKKYMQEDGTFVWNNLPTGKYTFFAYLKLGRDKSTSSWTQFAETPELTQPGQSLQTIFSTKIGRSRLYGMITLNGKPYCNKLVKISPYRSQGVLSTNTDEMGNYQFNQLKDGEYTLSISDTRNTTTYHKVKQPVTVSDETKFDFVATSSNSVTISFDENSPVLKEGYFIENIYATNRFRQLQLYKDSGKWTGKENVNNEYVFRLHLRDIDRKLVVYYPPHPIKINSTINSVDLGTQTLPTVESLLVDIDYVHTPSDYLKEEAIDLVLKTESGFIVGTIDGKEGTKNLSIPVFASEETFFLDTAEGGYSNMGEPIPVKIKKGEENKTSIQVAPHANLIFAVFHSDPQDLNPPVDKIPSRYILSCKEREHVLTPRYMQIDDNWTNKLDRLKSRKTDYAVNGVLSTAIIPGRHYTLTVEFENYQSVTKEFDSNIGPNILNAQPFELVPKQ